MPDAPPKPGPAAKLLIAVLMVAPLAWCASLLPPHGEKPGYVLGAQIALLSGYLSHVYEARSKCVDTEVDGAWLIWCGPAGQEGRSPIGGVYRVLPAGGAGGWRLISVNGKAATHAERLPDLPITREPDIGRDRTDIEAALLAAAADR